MKKLFLSLMALMVTVCAVAQPYSGERKFDGTHYNVVEGYLMGWVPVVGNHDITRNGWAMWANLFHTSFYEIDVMCEKNNPEPGDYLVRVNCNADGMVTWDPVHMYTKK